MNELLLTILISAICSVESDNRDIMSFDSGSFSYGRCQVKHNTAVQVGYKGSPINLLDKKTNYAVAKKYLTWQLKRYGNVEEAVAAYNSGSVKRNSSGTLINQRYVRKVMKRFSMNKNFGGALAIGDGVFVIKLKEPRAYKTYPHNQEAINAFIEAKEFFRKKNEKQYKDVAETWH